MPTSARSTTSSSTSRGARPCARLEGGAYSNRQNDPHASCEVGIPPGVLYIVNRDYLVDEEKGVINVFCRFGSSTGGPDSHTFRFIDGKIRGGAHARARCRGRKPTTKAGWCAARWIPTPAEVAAYSFPRPASGKGCAHFRTKAGARWGFGKDLSLRLGLRVKGANQVIEVEVQNETNQNQERIRFAAVPRIGEGVRLMRARRVLVLVRRGRPLVSEGRIRRCLGALSSRAADAGRAARSRSVAAEPRARSRRRLRHSRADQTRERPKDGKRGPDRHSGRNRRRPSRADGRAGCGAVRRRQGSRASAQLPDRRRFARHAQSLADGGREPGYAAAEAEDGREALGRCEAGMPDLILLDWNMPVMSRDRVHHRRCAPRPAAAQADGGVLHHRDRPGDHRQGRGGGCRRLRHQAVRPGDTAGQAGAVWARPEPRARRSRRAAGASSPAALARRRTLSRPADRRHRIARIPEIDAAQVADVEAGQSRPGLGLARPGPRTARGSSPWARRRSAGGCS